MEISGSFSRLTIDLFKMNKHVQHMFCGKNYKITNELFMKKSGCTLGQIKQWSKALLGADKRAGQAMGVARYYTIENALRLYLCGYLVVNHKFTIRQAVIEVEKNLGSGRR